MGCEINASIRVRHLFKAILQSTIHFSVVVDT